MTWVDCARCKCRYWLPEELHTSARASEKIGFFCPYGHPQYFPQGETEETRIRRERDRLKQDAARLEDERSQAIARAEKAERATKRLKKRSAAGSCPCCQRTFANMAQHMKHQHPEWVKETGANVVPLKRAADQ